MKIVIFFSATIVLASRSSRRRELFELHLNGQREYEASPGEIELSDLMLIRALMLEEEIDKYTSVKQRIFTSIQPRLRTQKLQGHFDDLFNQFYLRYFLEGLQNLEGST